MTQGQWRHLMMSSSSLDHVAFGISTPTYVQIVATLYDYASGCDPAGQGPHFKQNTNVSFILKN